MSATPLLENIKEDIFKNKKPHDVKDNRYLSMKTRQILIGWQNPCYGSHPGTNIKKIEVTTTPEKEESYWPSMGAIHYVEEETLYVTKNMFGYVPYEKRDSFEQHWKLEKELLPYYNKLWEANYIYLRFEDIYCKCNGIEIEGIIK